MSFKKHLRLFLINLFSLWAVAEFIPGVSFSGGAKTLISAAIALTVVNFIIRPLLKLLLLPINLVTMGAFRWLVNVLTIYLVTILVPEFKVGEFLFSGFSYQGFIIPEIYLGTFWVFILTSFLISIITTFLLWLRN